LWSLVFLVVVCCVVDAPWYRFGLSFDYCV
jgi:hypothetical protein